MRTLKESPRTPKIKTPPKTHKTPVKSSTKKVTWKEWAYKWKYTLGMSAAVIAAIGIYYAYGPMSTETLHDLSKKFGVPLTWVQALNAKRVATAKDDLDQKSNDVTNVIQKLNDLKDEETRLEKELTEANDLRSRLKVIHNDDFMLWQETIDTLKKNIEENKKQQIKVDQLRGRAQKEFKAAKQQFEEEQKAAVATEQKGGRFSRIS
jgi:hypothetical protein